MCRNNVSVVYRCGHVKLGDFGSSARLSEGGCSGVAVGTADYMAPELLAAADCAAHTVCQQYCARLVTTAISSCDYWSLGVIAFEMVTLRRPFSTGEEDSIAEILSNIQKCPLGSRVCAVQRTRLSSTSRRGPRSPPVLRPSGLAHPLQDNYPLSLVLAAGYSYVAAEENEDHNGGFNASHDCTAIDLATFKSAEKLAAMRSREISSLQAKLAEAEAQAGVTADRIRQEAEAEAERQRVRLQAEITALSLQNKWSARSAWPCSAATSSWRPARPTAAPPTCAARAPPPPPRSLAERDLLQAQLQRHHERLLQLQADCQRARADADAARAQQQHYKDSIAKERAIRRQTLSGGEAESREAAARIATAEANAAKEMRARQAIEAKLDKLDQENKGLRTELDEANRNLMDTQERLCEKQRMASTCSDQVKELQTQLAQERVRASTLLAQVQELERGMEESVRRESALEEQCARTEARLAERLRDAEARAAAALHDDARHREKVNTLEQLVRQLEREVSALEKRSCGACAAAASTSAQPESDRGDLPASARGDARKDTHSDTESARSEEIATLRQEARAANLARWRKEREYNELSVETKSTTRDLKRAEERLANAIEARKTAEQKAGELATELAKLRPEHELATKEAERLKMQFDKLAKTHEVVQAEVDRSRNDIRKLKSELQYSEKRRLHAEEQEELSSRERTQLRDDLHLLRRENAELAQVSTTVHVHTNYLFMMT
ncbi:hypothetical protein HF086_006066 [Spodoptera exigua]|uniref:Protein kinase domain-containing protein n=1 Tax=Spodoptera exigua TaxID=7107 RepID=A0A922SKT3_SPOEX|nr:hypothetical protein HF086_006066 [Spodoptera exigua]